jgi:hypothetical protein
MQSVELVLRWYEFDNCDTTRIRSDDNVICENEISRMPLPTDERLQYREQPVNNASTRSELPEMLQITK